MESRTTPWLGAIAAAALSFAAPGDARAGDEFEDGFKDELGRIAAHHAFGVGRAVLGQVLLAGDPGYYPPYYGYSDYPIYGRYYDRDDDDWRPRHHYRDRHWGHGYRSHRWHRHHGPRWGGWGHHRHPGHGHHRHHHGCRR
jgi:hypothetical protein